MKAFAGLPHPRPRSPRGQTLNAKGTEYACQRSDSTDPCQAEGHGPGGIGHVLGGAAPARGSPGPGALKTA